VQELKGKDSYVRHYLVKKVIDCQNDLDSNLKHHVFMTSLPLLLSITLQPKITEFFEFHKQVINRMQFLMLHVALPRREHDIKASLPSA
jgi:hypothetical protein